ncbi:MAG: hypothetical protein AAGA56_10315 [Myxococcota bacterium]
MTLSLRNSIVFSRGGDANAATLRTCPTNGISHTAFDDDFTEAPSGDGNTTSSFDASRFADFDAGDLRLTAARVTAFANVAEWTPGDPTADIDREARPAAADPGQSAPDIAGPHLGP